MSIVGKVFGMWNFFVELVCDGKMCFVGGGSNVMYVSEFVDVCQGLVFCVVCLKVVGEMYFIGGIEFGC